MIEFQSGKIEGKPWISGDIPVGKNRIVYLDTRTGEGVAEICKLMGKFVSYQSTKVSFPAMSREDIAQDIYMLMVEAIPKYNIEKKTNMLTFLQGHVKNRLINKCKFFSEKKRRATFCHTGVYKVRCPSCRKLSTISNKTLLVCSHCGETSNSDRKAKWKKYNMPILPIPFTCIEDKLPEEVNTIADVVSNSQSLSSFLGKATLGVDTEVQLKIDFMKLYNNLDDTNKTIISMLMEGCSYKEISRVIGISEKAAYARVAKIIKSYRSK